MLYPADFFLDQAQTSPHIHFIYDLTNRHVVFINAAYGQVLQGHPAQVNEELPALLARLHPDELPTLRSLWKHWSKGALQEEIELRLVQPKQPDQWFCLTPHWHQGPDGHILLGGVLRDVSVERQHKENADKFSSKKNMVLGILTHDLAGAFALLQQLTEYVHEELGPQTKPQIAHMLELMQSTSKHSMHLIQDLVDQEFLESSTVPLKYERVDLSEKVRECVEPFRRAPGWRHKQLLLELPEEPVFAEVDITKLLQVVSNLVTNSLKFTPEGKHIVVRVVSHPNAAHIVVADEGIGIPKALHPQLFEQFTPARRRGLNGEPTTGLGLSLCKTIVELHHGTLTFSSAEGEGTTFVIELPTQAPPAA